MTTKDYNDAADALINWFQSQDIMPADAGIIMSKVVANQLVHKSRDIEDLGRAVNLYKMLLAVDIADCLRA